MQQQISDSELELMKIIWGSGGTALYAQIMSELDKSGNPWKKNTVLTLLSRLIEKGFFNHPQNWAAQRICRVDW